MRGLFILISPYLLVLFFTTNINAQVESNKKESAELAFEMSRYINNLDKVTELEKKNNVFYFYKKNHKVGSYKKEIQKINFLEKYQTFQAQAENVHPSYQKKIDDRLEVLKSFQTAFELYAFYIFENEPLEKNDLCEVLHFVTFKESLIKQCEK